MRTLTEETLNEVRALCCPGGAYFMLDHVSIDDGEWVLQVRRTGVETDSAEDLKRGWVLLASVTVETDDV